MKKTLLSILVILLFPAIGTKAQLAYPMPEQKLWPESPHSARLRQVTMPTPAMATGAVSLDVPMWNLTVDDLEIPFTLRYLSNGIKASDDPYPVGYGWSFLPAFRITRQVMGRPDGCPHTYVGDVSGTLSWERKFCCMVRQEGLGIYEGCDSEHDIFTIHLPGISFNAYYDRAKAELIAPGHREYRMECILDANGVRGITAITVTDPQGRVWNFSTQGRLWNSKALSEWGLTEVSLPSGRKLSFTWNDKGAHIPMVGRRNSYYFLYCISAYMQFDTYDKQGNIDLSVAAGGSVLNLTGVTFPGGNISITYNSSGTTTISRFTVKAGTETVEDIKFSHGTSVSDLTMLSSVTFRDGSRYSFEYDPQRFTASDVRDYWGYHKSYKIQTSDPDVPPFIFGMLGGYGQSRNVQGYDRRPDASAMQARILKKVTYPTGGTAEWEYEPHRFAETDFIDGKHGNFTLSSRYGGKLSFGGGLRVRKITLKKDASDSSPRIVEYVYGTGGDGLAVAEALPTASTFISDVSRVMRGSELFNHTLYTDVLEAGMITVNADPCHESYRFGDPVLWYEEVTEIHAEGKTVHKFSKPYYNRIEVATAETTYPGYLGSVFAGGPVEISTETSRLSGTDYEPVSTVTREYGWTQEPPLRNRYIVRRITMIKGTGSSICNTDPDLTNEDINAYGAYVYNLRNRIYDEHSYTVESRAYALSRVTTTEHTSTGNISRTLSYSYVNGTGLISKETLSDGTDTETTSYSYPEDINGVSRLMWNANCRGVVTGIATAFGGKTEYVRPDYNQIDGNVFRPLCIFRSRGDGQEKAINIYYWNNDGTLGRIMDAAGVPTAWTWDATGQYPLTQTVAGSLTSRASWKPLVGVKTLTDPSGLVSSFEYDSGRRLTKTVVGGRTMATYSYSVSQTGDNSMTSRPYTAADIAEPIVERIDGLGRTWGVFTKHSSGTVATLTDYDAMGRPYRRWAPTAVSSATLGADAVRTAVTDTWGSTPYDLTVYEASPRGMPTSVTRAGAAWHDNGKKMTAAVYANDSKTYACPLYIAGDDGVTASGNRPDGTLRVEVITDEDGIRTETYTDMRGLTVRVKRGGAATDYVHDGYGDLRYVLPPGVSGSGKRTDATMKSLAYWYDYDSRGRLLMRKLPGCREEYFRYDDADRLVAEKTRDLPSGIWRLYAYDRAGRRVLAMDCRISDTDVSEYARSPRTASLAGGGGYQGYVISPSAGSLPSDVQVVWAGYYDSHDFIDTLGLDDDFRYIHPFTGLGLAGRAAGSQFPVADTPGGSVGKLTGIYTGGIRVDILRQPRPGAGAAFHRFRKRLDGYLPHL